MGYTIIGFTGTRNGLNLIQINAIDRWLEDHPGIKLAHHGMCEGADVEFDVLCVEHGISRTGWPGVNSTGQAASRGKCSPEKVMKEAPYLMRDQFIVDSCEVLLVGPKSSVEERRSGTWATCRMARRANRPTVIFWPDGEVEG